MRTKLSADELALLTAEAVRQGEIKRIERINFYILLALMVSVTVYVIVRFAIPGSVLSGDNTDTPVPSSPGGDTNKPIGDQVVEVVKENWLLAVIGVLVSGLVIYSVLRVSRAARDAWSKHGVPLFLLIAGIVLLFVGLAYSSSTMISVAGTIIITALFFLYLEHYRKFSTLQIEEWEGLWQDTKNNSNLTEDQEAMVVAIEEGMKSGDASDKSKASKRYYTVVTDAQKQRGQYWITSAVYGLMDLNNRHKGLSDAFDADKIKDTFTFQYGRIADQRNAYLASLKEERDRRAMDSAQRGLDLIHDFKP
jgi:hypothetical protein